MPWGIPGMGLVMEGAMQQAAQPGRQFMAVLGVVQKYSSDPGRQETTLLSGTGPTPTILRRRRCPWRCHEPRRLRGASCPRRTSCPAWASWIFARAVRAGRDALV
ncbi:hypothetical protein EZ242_16190 [Ramlibacter rhizophilus]|uniref:Uncharacterized protein n=1 Tax=Ramlibacter rhizophilus TaxID=1781167 RepID=A0A4Z0BJB5_9BURK|nr:hypothetical protein EZ242_16190 [Ramlibacter rhizophilus]